MTRSDASTALDRVVSLPLTAGTEIEEDLSPSPAASVTGASPHMYLAVFGTWLLALAWFHPRLASLLDMAGGPVGWAALAFFIGFTELAWLYGLFNIGVLVFAAIYRRQQRHREPIPIAAAGEAPPVALLYTTCNDFVEKSALSCVNQQYPSFTVYILDDSSNPAFRSEVDRFAARHPGRVQVVRRPDRRGFKAGNINHALRNVATEPLFALADADEILPPDFLARLAPRLIGDPGCGFVQASHRYNPDAPSAFSASLGTGIDSHWRWYQPLRNRYGFVIPETMRAFRIRHMKWTRGTCEFLFREMGRALRSRRIPLVEKLDVLFPTLNLPLSLLYFLFILDANVVLPAFFGEPRAMTMVAGGAELTVPFTLLDARFLPVMAPDFYAITLLTLLAPVLCFILDMWRTPARLLRFLGHSTAAYGTLGPLSSIGVLLYLATGKAVFHVTADLFAGSHPDHLAVQGLEILCGVAFAVICLQTFQVSFMGLSLGFILLPVLHHKRWENPLLRMLVHVPFAFILLGIALGGLSLLGLSTVLFGYGFHF